MDGIKHMIGKYNTNVINNYKLTRNNKNIPDKIPRRK